MDTFDDVRLDGPRISDDPTRWILPKSLVNKRDFFSWWEELRSQDDALFDAGITRSRRETLLWLADEYALALSESDGTLHAMSKIRSLIHNTLGLGLTIHQCARLFGETAFSLLHKMYFKENLTTRDCEMRLLCERLLRERTPLPEVTRQTGLDGQQIRRFAKLLGVERVRTDGGFGIEIREQAVALRRAGWSNPTIAAHLGAQFGVTIPTGTVAKWWQRANEGAA